MSRPRSRTGAFGPQLLVAAVIITPFVVGSVAGAVGGPDGAPEAAGVELTDPEIVESSGLVVGTDTAVTVNDSGDSARVFTVDLHSGDTVGVTTWRAETDDGEPVDIEALAPAGDGHVWVGDIGDNRATRETVTVYRVPVGTGDREVEAEAYELAYPDGPSDAEALLVGPQGRLHVATKGLFAGTLFAAPRRLDPDRVNRLEPVADVGGIVTDGAFFPGGDRLVLRDYDDATVHAFPSMEVLGEVELPEQQQGEGIAVDPEGQVWISTEGQFSELTRVELPDRVKAADRGTGTPEPTGSPGPARGERTDVADPPRGSDDPGPAAGPWLLGGAIGVVALLVLGRSLRPR